jgi:hypothetical protein
VLAGLELVNVARSHVNNPSTVNQCANFVSSCIAEAKVAAAMDITWKPSGYVPDVVAEFPAAKIVSGAGSAQPGDLIVFGDNEHVAIYSGGNKVIGTAGGYYGTPDAGVFTVKEQDISTVGTDHYMPPAHPPYKTLVTGLGGGVGGNASGGGLPVDLNPADALGSALAAGGGALSALGSMWQGVTDIPGAIAATVGTMLDFLPVFAINAGVVLVCALLILIGFDRLVSDEQGEENPLGGGSGGGGGMAMPGQSGGGAEEGGAAAGGESDLALAAA